jgi:hypothetical protein
MEENNHQLPPEDRHEHADVNIWAVGRFAIALAILCLVASGLLFGLFRYFTWRDGGPLPPDKLNIDARSKPPAPTLQEQPVTDLREMRAAEDQLLNSYGWIDQAHGVARVPIARAIDMLAQKGLPVRQEMPAASNVTVPTESGLGAKMQAPGGPLNQGPGAGGRGPGTSGRNGQGN